MNEPTYAARRLSDLAHQAEAPGYCLELLPEP